MEAVDGMGPSSSQTRFFEGTSEECLPSAFKGCEGWPESTFPASNDGNDLMVDDIDVGLLDCFSGEVAIDEDDLFAAYIDVKKLEEKETTDDNNGGDYINNGGFLQEDTTLRNGGGFVVESGSGSLGQEVGGGVRQKRKERTRNGMMKATTPVTKKRQRRSPQSCLAAEEGFIEPRKAMAAEELAELWAVDPKRAKRIVANRHSAARSKERKAQYIVQLETKVKKLGSEVAFLNTRLTVNEKETTEMNAEKTQLKCQLQSMECEAEQIDAQIESMEQEIQWLRSVTWEMDSIQTQQSQSPAYFQFHKSPSPNQHNNWLPLLQNCQQGIVQPYLHVAGSEPLF